MARASKSRRRPAPIAARLLGLARLPRAALLVGTALQACTVLVIALPAAAAGPAPNAQPTGGRVVAGSASIGQTAQQTTIDQSSQRAAVDWNSFDVGSQQTVTFRQPSSSAVTLNRVTGPDPSQIAGRIQANGQVVLTNQSGVIFTQGAQVDTAGLIVSAAGISNRNFMAGRMVFDQAAKPDAKIVNQGTITVRQAGLAALVAPQVANSGTINARLGHVVLAGARAATLDLYGDGLVSIDVTRQVTEAPIGPDGKPVTALVTNSGAIVANGGSVQLSAAAVDGVVTNLVTAGGTISAASKGARTGTIVVDAAGGGATVTGVLAAEGRAPGTAGGQVQVNATGRVAVASGARVSASGKAGGGTVALGTTLARAQARGTAPAKDSTGVGAPAAASLAVQPGATVTADATARGDGGRIVLLSAGGTRMDGGLSARGGPQAGNGGFVEVSGKTLGITGAADVSAPAGAAGSILLDPDFLTIVGGSAGSGSQDPTFVLNGGSVAASDPSVGSDTISNSVINAFVGNVLLQANKTLTVAANIALTNAPGQNLTLEAGGAVTVNSGIVVTASGDVILATGGAGPFSPPSAQPSPSISILGTVGSTGGSVGLLAGPGGSIAIGPAGLLAAAPGQRLTLQSDALTVASGAGSLRASGGTVEIAPASTIGMNVLGTTGLAVPASALGAVDADVLRLGAATVNRSRTTTAASIAFDGNVTLPGTVATLDVHAIGAVGIPLGGRLTNIGTLTGSSASFDGGAVSGSSIGHIGTYAATGDFSFAGISGIALDGPITAHTVNVDLIGASGISVTGSVLATGTLSLSGAAIALQDGAVVQGTTATLFSATTLALNGSATLGQAGGVVDLNAGLPGFDFGVTEASTASIAGATLQGTRGGINGNASLLGKNALSSLGTFPVSGKLSLADTVPLTIAGAVSTAGAYLQAGTVSIGGAGGLTAAGATISIQADKLGIAPGGTVTAATFELAPFTAGTGIALGAAGSYLASLDGIGTSAARIGAVTQPGGGVATTAGNIVLAGGFGTAATALELDASGAISQMAGVLTASRLTVNAGGTVSLPDANVIAALGPITAAGFTLDDSGRTGSLTIDGPISGAADVSIGGAGTIVVAGSIAATGIVALNAGDGGIAIQGGALLSAGTLDLSSGGGVLEAASATVKADRLWSSQGVTGSVLLAGTLNAIGSIGSFAVASGDFGLIDTAALRVEGPLQATDIAVGTGAQSILVAGTVVATGSTGLTGTGITLATGAVVTGATIALDGSSGGIALLSGATLGATGSRIDLATSGGGVVEDGAAVIVAGTLGSVGRLTGAVDLAGTANAIAALGDLSVSHGSLSLVDARDLTVAGTVATEQMRMVDAGTVTVSGSIVPAAGWSSIGVGLTAAAIAIPGLANAGADGTMSLVATGGGIAETGTIVAGTLTGSAFGTATLAGVNPTANRIATLGDFDAAALTLNDGRALSVAGLVQVGSSVSIATTGSLTFGGTIAPSGASTIAVGLTGSVLSLPGAIDDGGSGTTSLVATAGPISQTGRLTAGTLSGSAAGTAIFTGANRVATLRDFSAEAFALNDSRDLEVSGTVRAGASVTIVDSGTLLVAGAIVPSGTSVIAVRLTAASLNLPGIVSDGGAGTTALVATAGGIDQTGTLVAGTLSGGAAGVANFAGAGTGIDQIAALGDFAADSFNLNDGRALTVAGVLTAGASVAIVDTGSLKIAGSIVPTGGGTAISIDLTGATITIPGVVGAGSAGNLALNASGGITETGTLVAGTLTVGTAATADLSGADALANRIGVLAGVTGDDFTLRDGIGLSVAGPILAGGVVNIVDTGTMTVSGTIAPGTPGTAISVGLTADTLLLPGLISDGGSGTVSLVANAGSIVAPGTLLAGSLSGSAAGTVSLSGANQVQSLGDWQAATFGLNDGRSLSLAGTLAVGQAASLVVNGDLAVTGAFLPSTGSTIAVALTADTIAIPGVVSDGGAGTVALTALRGDIQGTGTVVAGTLSGSAPGRIALTGANRIATLGDTDAASLALSDARDLTVAGTVRAGTSVAIASAGPLLVTGSIVPQTAPMAVSLTAGSIAIPGLVSDGGAGTTALVATTGGIAETGTLIVGTLTGFAATTADLSGASTSANQVSTLNGFSAGSFLLRDGQALTVDGVLDASSAVTILDSGALLVGGTIAPGVGSAIAVGLTADAIAIAGEVSDGGRGNTSLVARNGGIAETGVLRSGALSGSAASSIVLTGTSPASNTIAALGPMTAGTDLALYTAGSLDVVGTVAAGAGHTIAIRADGLSLHAALSAPGGWIAIAPTTTGRTIGLDATRRTGALSLLQSDLDAIHTGTLTLGSVVQANPAAAILAGAIEVNGPATVGAGSASLLRLYATGTIGGPGALGAAALTGRAGSVALSGPNAVANLSDFAAPGGFSLADTIPLAIGGAITGGPSIVIADTQGLAVSGSLASASVSLSGSALTLSGGIAGADAVSLTAAQGDIVGTGGVATAVFSGSAPGRIVLAGGNAIAALGNVSAANGFMLNDTADLSVIGIVSGGPAVTLTGAGALSISGSLNAGTVALSANSIALTGAITGTSDVILTSAGAISGAGTLAAGRLTGSGDALNLTGPNAIATLGDFSARSGFSLINLPNLRIAGAVDGGSAVSIADAGSLSVSGGVSAGSVALAAQAIDIPGQIHAPAGLSLAATSGGIQETGTIVTGLLSGSAASSASFTGNNTIAVLGDFTAAGLTLVDSADLLVNGAVNGGSFVMLSAPGQVSIPGSLTGRTGTLTVGALAVAGSLTGIDGLTLTATADGIAGGGTVTTSRLSGRSAAGLDLTGPNRIASLQDFAAAGGIRLNNQPDLAIGGTIDGGPSIAIVDAGTIAVTGTLTGSDVVSLTSTGGDIAVNRATLHGLHIDLTAAATIGLTDGTLLTGGFTPNGRVDRASGLLPGNGGAGVLLSAPRVVQTGTLTIAGSTGGDPVAEVSAGRTIEFGTLVAPQTWLILDMQNGFASAANLIVQRLDIYYSGTGGGALLNGTVGGLSGANAAENAFISPQPDANYLLNGCPVGSPNCIVLVRDPIPVQRAPQTVEFVVPRPTMDDPELFGIIPNVSRQDY